MYKIVYNDEYYLTEELNFSKDISKAAKLNIEYITKNNFSSDIYNMRIVINNQYINIDRHSIYLTKILTDNTILTQVNGNKLLSNYGYLTCNNVYKLALENEGESTYFFTKLRIIYN